MKIHRVPQRSEAWAALRTGKFTASRAKDMLKKVAKGEAAGRRDLRIQLACEQITGLPQEDPWFGGAMVRGVDLEPAAVAAYEDHTGEMVLPVGFLEHDDLAAGCSPDGLISGGGILEIKCPKTATHLSYLDANTLPEEYAGQVLHTLWISGAPYLDFVSYDDRLPPGLEFFCVRVSRDSQMAALTAYDGLARAFLREVDAMVAKLRQRAQKGAAA